MNMCQLASYTQQELEKDTNICTHMHASLVLFAHEHQGTAESNCTVCACELNIYTSCALSFVIAQIKTRLITHRTHSVIFLQLLISAIYFQLSMSSDIHVPRNIKI